MMLSDLEKWPLLHKRAIQMGLQSNYSIGSWVEAKLTKYLGLQKLWGGWEGTNFWEALAAGNIEECKEMQPELFFVGEMESLLIPKNDDDELQELVDEINEGCIEATVEGLSLLARIVLHHSPNSSGHSDLQISSKLSLQDVTELMEEIDDHYEKHELNCSAEARFSSDGTGDLYIKNFWYKVEDSPSGKDLDKLVLGWGG